jgi:RNA 2',3'-cyclic 3'-phosphodiesterase
MPSDVPKDNDVTAKSHEPGRRASNDGKLAPVLDSPMDEGRSARVFLAVGVSKTIADRVAELERRIRRGAPARLFRFVDAEQAHVTLKFFGQRSKSEQLRIAGAAAVVAQRESPFTIAFGGLGVFPDERRPHTLWMGLAHGKSDLVALAARLETELARAGFPPEERPYVPHLTVARVKFRPPPGLVKKLLAGEIDESGAAPDVETGAQQVDSFALMESRPGGGGVRYVPRQIFRLEKACTPSK